MMPGVDGPGKSASRPGSHRGFAEALGARGHRRDRTEHFRFYRGLALKQDLTADTG